MAGKILRMLVMLVLGLATAGFGLCGAAGTIGGVVTLAEGGSDRYGIGPTALGCGLAGLAIAALGFWILRRMSRTRPSRT